MAILRERKIWRRKPGRRARNPPSRLHPDEANNVLAALFRARLRYRSWAALRKALGVGPGVYEMTLRGDAPADAGLAIRVARVLCVSVDEVLSGDYAKLSRCIRCNKPIVPSLKGRHLVRGAAKQRRTGPCRACLRGATEAAIEIHQIGTEQAQNIVAALWVVRDHFSEWGDFVEAMALDMTTVEAVAVGEMIPPLVLLGRLARVSGIDPEAIALGRFARMLTCVLCNQLSPPTVQGQLRWAAATSWRAPGVCPICLRQVSQ